MHIFLKKYADEYSEARFHSKKRGQEGFIDSKVMPFLY